jgi:WD40 repeat protein
VGATMHIEAPATVRGLDLVDGGGRLTARLAGPRLVSWSCADGRLLTEVTYRGPALTAGALAPAGDRLAVATGDGGVRMLDASTLAVVTEMRPSSSPLGALAFSADGALLAGFARDPHLELTVWNVATGARLVSFADAAQEAAGIAFHPSGRSAAISLLAGDVVLLDLASARPTRTLSDARMASEALAFSLDGSSLLAASYDGALLAWDTGRWGVRHLEGLRGANGLALTPDGGRAVVSRTSYNPPETPAEARIVDLGTGRVLAGQQLGIASIAAVAFTGPERARVASARGTSITLRELGG